MRRVLKNTFIFMFLLLCMFNKNVHALINKNVNFENITIDNGLPQALAEYIYQDSFGYIWIGTNDGLSRYNGSEFKVYKNVKNNSNSISNNMISALVEDKDKNLWIGTDGGLNKMNLITGDITRYLVSDEDKKYSNTVVDEIFIDSKERLWVCTINGLNLYDIENDKFVRVAEQHIENTGIQDIDEDYEGNIWLSTTIGLYKYNPTTDKVDRFFENEDIFSIMCGDKKIYLGTRNNGLIILDLEDYSITEYNHDSNNPDSIPSNYIRDMLLDSDGTIWIATDQGLAILDESNESFYTYRKSFAEDSICDDNIVSLYEDRTGVIWVGTFNGLSKINKNKYFTIYRNNPTDDNSLSNSSVCGIYEDDEGMLWVGTFNSGINKVDKKKNQVTRFYSDDKAENTLSSNRIKDVTGIGNEIWIATDVGLNKYDKDTGEFTIYKHSDDENSVISDAIRTLYIDKEGLLWIGTKWGLCTFDRKSEFTSYNEILEANGVFEKTISAIYEDSQGLMWFGLGNDGGLVSYNRETKEVKNYLSNDYDVSSLSFNNVRTITEDSKGNIWVGTQSGLNKFNKEIEKFNTYTYEDGLSNDFIYGALVDENDNIWVSTNYGISMYDQENDKFVRYYKADGLSTNEFNGFSYHQSNNGNMYFGGVDGLVEFSPLEIEQTMDVGDVIIESIQTTNGVEIIDRENITLEYNSRDLSVRFFIPEYKNKSQIQYVYKLDGFDKEWIHSGSEKFARYTNLQPGKYKMIIYGRSYNGIWSDGAELNITVKNSIWKSPFAYFTYILIIFGSGYFFYNYMRILDSLVDQRTSQLNNKLEENKKLYEKLIEAEKYKNNYFINLSHELRTPLNVILSVEQLITILTKEGKKISDEKLVMYMSTLKSNSNRLLRLINNIIDTSKIESGSYKLEKELVNIVSLVEDTALTMVDLVEVNGIELIIDPEIEELMVQCDKLDIERCVINLIGNAIKFTGRGGSIIVTIIDLGNKVKITVKDTGSGIDAKDINHIFDRFGQGYNSSNEEFGGSGLGLTLTKNLINLHGGDITVVSEKGKGSEFIIVLPVE